MLIAPWWSIIEECLHAQARERGFGLDTENRPDNLQAQPTAYANRIIYLDLAVYDRHNQLVLAVEIKTKRNTTTEWAGRLRRNILAHGFYPKVPFFLLTFPDKFYLWTPASNKEHDEPTLLIDAQLLLRPYFEQPGVSPDTVSGTSMELIIASWISKYMHEDIPLDTLTEAEQWLIDSGLQAAIAGGTIFYDIEVAA